MPDLIFIPILVTLGIYLVPVFLLNRRNYRRAQDYYVSSGFTSRKIFQNSAIAYALQMATFGPFFAWGAAGDFWPAIVNSFFLCLGLFLVYKLRIPLITFLDEALSGDTSITVHEFLARSHGNSSLVRVTSSALTVFALTGLVVGEIFGVTAVLKPIFLQDTGITYIFVFAMLTLMFLYTFAAGNSGVMRSDQLQLGVTYVGLFATVAGLAWFTLQHSHQQLSDAAFFSMAASLVICVAILVYRRLSFLDTSPVDTSSNQEVENQEPNSLVLHLFQAFEKLLNFFIPISIGCAASLLAWILFSHPLGVSSTFGALARSLSAGTSLSFVGYLALFLLPLFYQVVDITNWQRLAAYEKSKSDAAGADESLLDAFRVYAIESSLIWMIMCLFGALCVFALASPTVTISDISSFVQALLNSPNALVLGILSSFLAAVFAIALSTISSVFSASLGTIRYDIIPALKPSWSPGVADASNEDLAQQWTKVAGICLYLIIASGLYWVDSQGLKFDSGKFLAFLFAFYCAQLSFVPLILGPLYRKKGEKFGTITPAWAFATLMSGTAAGIGMLLIYFQNDDDRWLWGAVPACLFCAFVMFGIGRARSKQQASPPKMLLPAAPQAEQEK
jgi:hypothetical protein